MVGTASAQALAQATVKPDGEWRYALTAGATFASGNTVSKALNASGDVVRATNATRFTAYARTNSATTNGAQSADQQTVGAQYNYDLTPKWFGFNQAEGVRDRPSNIGAQVTASTGAGYNVVKSGDNLFALSAGVGYNYERYADPSIVAGGLRSERSIIEGLIAEETSNKIFPTTTFRQKFTAFPGLNNKGDFRSTFDAGLSVAMTPVLSLTTTLSIRYNNDPGAGVKRTDTLFITGLTVKID